MIRALFLVAVLAMASSADLRAIEYVPLSTYTVTPPTSSDIPNWGTGWTQPAVQPTGYTSTSGWNYVGSINGANSGTYLGNGWVLTATHVGAGTFNLNGVGYPAVTGSQQQITSTDLCLFQISPYPQLPALPLRTHDPRAYVSMVAMIGFGGAGADRNESWGLNTVTQINESIPLENTSYVSNDFLTLTGQSSSGDSSATNNYAVVVGDSGGGNFIFNTSSQQWELAGINETTGTATFSNGTTQNFSGCVQIDTYAGQIKLIMNQAPVDTPTMPKAHLVFLGGLILVAATRQGIFSFLPMRSPW
jgi:hypothetical protein